MKSIHGAKPHETYMNNERHVLEGHVADEDEESTVDAGHIHVRFISTVHEPQQQRHSLREWSQEA